MMDAWYEPTPVSFGSNTITDQILQIDGQLAHLQRVMQAAGSFMSFNEMRQYQDYESDLLRQRGILRQREYERAQRNRELVKQVTYSEIIGQPEVIVEEEPPPAKAAYDEFVARIKAEAEQPKVTPTIVQPPERSFNWQEAGVLVGILTLLVMIAQSVKL